MFNRIYYIVLVLSVTGFFSVLSVPASAGRVTIANTLHTLARERGKTCMVGHYHYASGKGKSQRQALKAAKRGWGSFTSFEYGGVWARFRLAANRGKLCQKGSSGQWSCSISARPCKR